MRAATLTSADRLSVAIFFALIIHALIILGVGFKLTLPKPPREAPILEITIAQTPSATTPKDYDFLAQANQDGGGVNDKAGRPRQQTPAITPGQDGTHAVDAAPTPTPPPRQQQQVVAGRESPQKTPSRPSETAPETPKPSAADLINASQQLAVASAFREDGDDGTRAPTKQRITARTKHHPSAAYMKAWIDKVEEVGNLNYPDEARRRRLSGSLILEVTIWPDGRLKDTRILEPSAHPALNEAALRIVRLAAPYAPVPDEVLQGHELLVITRTWEFVDQSGFTTR